MIVNAQNLTGLYSSFKTIFNEAFQETKTLWPELAMEVPSSTKEETYAWLGTLPAMREWVGDRNIHALTAHGYTIKNKSFETTIGVNRDDIEDDQYGVYKPMIQGLGSQAAKHPDKLLFDLIKAGTSTLCYDGQYFFDTDHPVKGASVANYVAGASGYTWYLFDLSKPVKPFVMQIRRKPEFVALDKPNDEGNFMRKDVFYGVDDRKNVGYGLWQLAYASKEPLTAESYAAGRAAMMLFKDDQGDPMDIWPTHLFVDPGYEKVAREIIESSTNDAGAGNPWYKSVQLVVVPRLAP